MQRSCDQAGQTIRQGPRDSVCMCAGLTVCVLQGLDHVGVQCCTDQHLHVAPEHLPHGTVVYSTFHRH